MLTLAVLAKSRVCGKTKMTLEELRLLRLVQGILVRNYIDTQRLDLEVIGTSVYVKGEFRVFDYHPSYKKTDRIERDLGLQRTLMHVEQQIRGLAEVSYLEMKLMNWERVGMQWVTKHEAS
jgi:hypothetical protein